MLPLVTFHGLVLPVQHALTVRQVFDGKSHPETRRVSCFVLPGDQLVFGFPLLATLVLPWQMHHLDQVVFAHLANEQVLPVKQILFCGAMVPTLLPVRPGLHSMDAGLSLSVSLSLSLSVRVRLDLIALFF